MGTGLIAGLTRRLRNDKEGASAAPSGFERRAPSVQNAVDIFAGNWASDLRDVLPGVESGPHRLFVDGRAQQAADALGRNGRFDGFSVLELGPLEGAHSHLLETLGAGPISAVEANAAAYLKCLVVKEALGLKARFLLGDFVEHLKSGAGPYDLIFASGVLYHMPSPLELIRLIAGATDRCFVWTQYFEESRCPGRTGEPASLDGFSATYRRRAYDGKGAGFWGGNQTTASWMSKDDILGAFAHFGLTDITVIEDQPAHPNGPAVTFAARRPQSSDN